MNSEERQQKILKTVRELMPLYDQTCSDRPDSVLRCAPNADRVIEALNVFLMVMLPGHGHDATEQSQDLGSFLNEKIHEGARLLRPELELAIPFNWLGQSSDSCEIIEKSQVAERAESVLLEFLSRFPSVRKHLIDDVHAAYNGDPAALSFAEVKVTYPSIMVTGASTCA